MPIYGLSGTTDARMIVSVRPMFPRSCTEEQEVRADGCDEVTKEQDQEENPIEMFPLLPFCGDCSD